MATAEGPDPGVGPLGPQSEEVTSPPRVERSDSIETTNPHTLDLETRETQTLDERTHTQVQVETRTHTRASRAEPPSLTYASHTLSILQNSTSVNNNNNTLTSKAP